MKKFLLLFLLINATMYSQKNFEFDNIIEFDTIKKAKLFEILNDWVAVTFNSANDVIQLSDKESGKIIIKGLRDYTFGRTIYNCYDGSLYFTLRIMLKDGKCRVSIIQLNHKSIHNVKCSLGTLTTSELYKTKGWGKKDKNKIWSHLKIESEKLNKYILSSIRDKVKSYSQEEKW